MRYEELTLRNAGYISPEGQQRIRNTRMLIAGCGIGSAFAETAIRLGYEKLIVVDHDTIEPHNLNRQDFTVADIGTYKVDALAKRLMAINPNAEIEIICDKVSVDNAADLAAKADFIFDTIDFLDLAGLVALHDACDAQKKTLLTAVNAGYGAAGFYFPATKNYSFRKLFALPEKGPVEGISYAETYANFIRSIEHRLDPVVVAQFFRVMKLLGEGKPCPAPQVAPGAACVAALAGTVAVRVAEGLPVLEAPEMLLVNMTAIVSP